MLFWADYIIIIRVLFWTDSSIANVPFKSRLQRFSRPRLLEAQQRDYDSDVGVGQSIARQIEGAVLCRFFVCVGSASAVWLEDG